jgi:hypothetical protein
VNDGTSDPAADGTPDPTAAFDLAGNPTRMAVLRALADAHGESPTDPWVGYGDLRERAGVADKGNFNYHLDRLEGLVEKGPAGYCVSPAGMRAVAAVASGGFDPERTWGPVEAPGRCLFCERSAALRYADGFLRLECEAGHVAGLPGEPSLLADANDRTVFDRIAYLVYREVESLRRGICPACEGGVEAGTWFGGTPNGYYNYGGDCERCGFGAGYPVGSAVLPHPRLLNFFADRGVDVRATPFWTLPFCRYGAETVLEAEPLRFRLEVEREGATLSFVLDGEGSAVAVEGP